MQIIHLWSRDFVPFRIIYEHLMYHQKSANRIFLNQQKSLIFTVILQQEVQRFKSFSFVHKGFFGRRCATADGHFIWFQTMLFQTL